MASARRTTSGSSLSFGRRSPCSFVKPSKGERGEDGCLRFYHERRCVCWATRLHGCLVYTCGLNGLRLRGVWMPRSFPYCACLAMCERVRRVVSCVLMVVLMKPARLPALAHRIFRRIARYMDTAARHMQIMEQQYIRSVPAGTPNIRLVQGCD